MSHPKRLHGDSLLSGADPLSVDVLLQLKRIMHLNRQLLMRTAASSGGHPAQAGCVRAIGAHESVTQRDLGEMLLVSPAALTTMLQRIERQGLIERWPDEDDQRLMRLRLTDAGHVLNEKLASAHLDYIDATITPLAEDDRRELARLLGLLGDNFETALGCGEPTCPPATDKDA